MKTGVAAALGVRRTQRRRALAVSTGVGLAGLALGVFQRHLPVGPLLLLGGGIALALVADRLTEAAAEVGLQVALVAWRAHRSRHSSHDAVRGHDMAMLVEGVLAADRFITEGAHAGEDGSMFSQGRGRFDGDPSP